MKLAFLILLWGWLAWGWAGEAVSPRFYHHLQKVEKLQRMGHYAQSLEQLQSLAKQAGNPLEHALVEIYLAHAYVALNRLPQASQAARRALQNSALPDKMRPNLLQVLGQIELQKGDFRQAARYLEQSLTLVETPSAEILYLAGYAHYRLAQWPSAIGHLRQALRLKTPPPEEWLQLLVACYLESKNWGEAEKLLKSLIMDRFHDQKFWQQLAGLYLAQDRIHPALAVMVLAYHTGRMTQKSLLEMARLYAHAGVPEKAARLFEKWFKEGVLPPSLKNLRLQSRLWIMARERQQAVEAQRQVVKLRGDGGEWLILAQLYMELEDWRKAQDSARQALRAGVKNPAQAQLLLGVAAYRSGNRKAARQALVKAKGYPPLKSQADYWLQCLEGSRLCP